MPEEKVSNEHQYHGIDSSSCTVCGISRQIHGVRTNTGQLVLPAADAGPRQTRFDEFDDPTHPAHIWWEKHGQYMMAGGGRKEYIWACRGWIAREQLAQGVEVTGDSMHEAAPPVPQEAAPEKIESMVLATEPCPDCGSHRHRSCDRPATAPGWALRVAEQIRLMLSDKAGPISLMNGKFDAAIAALIRQAGSERERALRTSLQTHWLSEIECNHYEQNDSAICACGWKSDRGFNVGKAVELWIDHVWAEASRLLGREA